MTSKDIDKPTSSPASADGLSLFGELASPTTSRSGPARARVSPSRARARGSEHATLDIFGQHGQHSSKSVALGSSLESRLRARMDSGGSTLFSLTWNDAVTPSGRRISARRASVLRTTDHDSTSWPTPVKEDARSSARHGYMISGNQGTTLLDAARMATWPTPMKSDEKVRANRGQNAQGGASLPEAATWATPKASDGPRGGCATRSNREHGTHLVDQAQLAPWATPVATELSNTLESYRAMKANMKSGPRSAITHPSLQAQLVVTGETASGSPAPTASRGQLNPDLSRWLQAFPVEWALLAPKKAT